MAKWGEINCPRCEDHDAAIVNLHREYERRGDTIADLEAKLAEVEEALEAIVVDDTWGLEHDVYMMCRAALRKLKGQKDE